MSSKDIVDTHNWDDIMKQVVSTSKWDQVFELVHRDVQQWVVKLQVILDYLFISLELISHSKIGAPLYLNGDGRPSYSGCRLQRGWKSHVCGLLRRPVDEPLHNDGSFSATQLPKIECVQSDSRRNAGVPTDV